MLCRPDPLGTEALVPLLWECGLLLMPHWSPRPALSEGRCLACWTWGNPGLTPSLMETVLQLIASAARGTVEAFVGNALQSAHAHTPVSLAEGLPEHPTTSCPLGTPQNPFLREPSLRW